MQMIMIPEERYNRMVESYDRAQEELREIRLCISDLKEILKEADGRR